MQWQGNKLNDADAAELRKWNAHEKRSFLEYQRAHLGWGVFVLRAQ